MTISTRPTRANFAPGHVPFEASGLPQQEGETDKAYEWRGVGCAYHLGYVEHPSGFHRGMGEVFVERQLDEPWDAYVARAGSPLTGKALRMATDGAEVGTVDAEAFWSAFEEELEERPRLRQYSRT